jgi:AraC-like DNA-binding protein
LIPAVFTASSSVVNFPDRSGSLRYPRPSFGHVDKLESFIPQKSDEEKTLALIFNQLQTYLKQSEPYRNSRYTLQDFSLETSIPGYLISRAVNQCYGSSFTNWINFHRVDCFLKMLMKNWKPGINLYELSLQTGFASKTAFINSFKRETGVTPGAYVRRVIRPSVISALT